MSEIKVGDRYKHESFEIEIKYVGDSSAFFISKSGKEGSNSLAYINTFYTKIEPSRKKIELFLCINSYGILQYLDSNFRYYRFHLKTIGHVDTNAQRVFPSQSMFIYADDFTIVTNKGENKC